MGVGLRVDTKVNNSNFSQGMANVVRTYKTSLSSMATATDNLTHKLQSIGKPIAALSSAIHHLFAVAAVAALQKYINKAIEAEQVNLKHELTLRAFGDTTGEVTKRLNKMVNVWHEKVLVSRADIKEIQRQLTISGVQLNQVEQMTKAVIGLSAKTENLDTATRLIIRAYNGNTKALERYGIRVNDVGELLEKTNKLFEIQEELAKTTAGKMTDLSNATSDLQKAIGAGFLKSFNSDLGETSKLIREMTPAVKVVAMGLGFIAQIGSGRLLKGLRGFGKGLSALDLGTEEEDLPVDAALGSAANPHVAPSTNLADLLAREQAKKRRPSRGTVEDAVGSLIAERDKEVERFDALASKIRDADEAWQKEKEQSEQRIINMRIAQLDREIEAHKERTALEEELAAIRKAQREEELQALNDKISAWSNALGDVAADFVFTMLKGGEDFGNNMKNVLKDIAMRLLRQAISRTIGAVIGGVISAVTTGDFATGAKIGAGFGETAGGFAEGGSVQSSGRGLKVFKGGLPGVDSIHAMVGDGEGIINAETMAGLRSGKLVLGNSDAIRSMRGGGSGRGQVALFALNRDELRRMMRDVIEPERRIVEGIGPIY